MSRPLDIRTATAEDREWAALLMSRSDPWITLGRRLEHCQQACRRQGTIMFVACAESQRCGFALLHERGVAGSPYLASIAVAPEWRSRGVGAALIARAEDHFRPCARHMFLCVSSFNPRARALYERLGYRPVGELPDYLIDGASELLMCKRL